MPRVLAFPIVGNETVYIGVVGFNAGGHAFLVFIMFPALKTDVPMIEDAPPIHEGLLPLYGGEVGVQLKGDVIGLV